jgi:hypothetical protein
MEVYIVLIDYKGVLAFQPFSRGRFDKINALFSKRKVVNSAVLFKIKLTYDEQQIAKMMIIKEKFLAAAKYLMDIKNKRGEIS